METQAWIVADWMARERGAAAWRVVRAELGADPPRRVYARALRGLRAVAPRGDFLLRVLARAAADGAGLRAVALARMAWWQGEVWRFQGGGGPFSRKPRFWLEREPRP